MHLSLELLIILLAMTVASLAMRRHARAIALGCTAFVALGYTLAVDALAGPVLPQRNQGEWPAGFALVPIQAPMASKVATPSLKSHRYAGISPAFLAEVRRHLEEVGAPEYMNRTNQMQILESYERARYAAFYIRSTAQRYFPGESRWFALAARKKAESHRFWVAVRGSSPERATEQRP